MSRKLRTASLDVHFGGLRAVDALDLELAQGEILGLIGPNGAGKTTLINALTGFQAPTGGAIHVDDADITRWTPARRARAGIVRTFQAIRLFAGMSVRRNVELGALGVGASAREAADRAASLLALAGLGARADLPAAALPHGEQRRVGILRALATRPGFLLLDEPAAGLNEADSDALLEFLRRAHGELGCGVLLVEHDMRLLMRLSQRVQVISFGRTICVGTPAQVTADATVIEAYLGSPA